MKKIYETPELDIEKFQFFATLDDGNPESHGSGTGFYFSPDDNPPVDDPFGED